MYRLFFRGSLGTVPGKGLLNDDDWLGSRLIEKPRWHLPVERRFCAVHPASRAVDRCDRCGQPFCAGCLQHVQRWRVCHACVNQFAREAQATQLPSRWRRARPEVLAAAGVVAVLALLFLVVQAVVGSAGSNVDAMRSAEIIGGKLNGGATQHVGSLRLTTSLAGPALPPALPIAGSGFRPGEVVKVTTEIDGPGALIGATAPRQEGVHRFAPVTTRADSRGELTVTVPLPAGTVIPATYRLQITATGNKGTIAALDRQGSRTVSGGEQRGRAS